MKFMSVFGALIVLKYICGQSVTCGQSIYVKEGCTTNGQCNQVMLHRDQLKQALNDVSSFLGKEFDRRCEGCKEHRNLSAIPRDREDLKQLGYKSTGVYTIYPKSGVSFQVRYDMSTAGGGWTVIQRRVSASDFYKTRNEYKIGFGDLDGNLWLGNDNIYTLTNFGNYSLRVDLTAPDGQSSFATCSSFSIGIEAVEYRLSIQGYSGNIGGSLDHQNGMAFSTKGRYNDIWLRNCAVEFSGAWWYRNCHDSNLNGRYGSNVYGKGLEWNIWRGQYVSMARTQLAIKRVYMANFLLHPGVLSTK